MKMTRALLGTALTVLICSPLAGQEPTGGAAPMQGMMQGTMMPCMQPAGDGAGAGMPGMPTQGMSGTHGQPMQQGPGMQGMQGMQGMHMSGAANMQEMACDCPMCAGQHALAGLLGRPAGNLGLTEAQTAELSAITARAREEARAILTPEQRSALDAQAANPTGMCMWMHGGAPAGAHPQP
jgi:hypothetical protein